MLGKNIEKKVKHEFQQLLDKYHCEIMSFNYYYKLFGDIIIEFRYCDSIFRFNTDKGVIYCNEQFICGFEYIATEKKSIKEKLLEVIETTIIEKLVKN